VINLMLDMEKKINEQHARIAELEKALREAKLPHLSCEDAWYSCPLSPDGCANDRWAADECNCGADFQNAAIDAVLGANK
jgi:hypothetical protein